MINTPTQVQNKKCVLWNANGLKSKCHELYQFIKQHKPGFVLITETLTPDEREEPYLRDYNAISAGKIQRKRGVAIYVHKNISFTKVNLETNNMEAIAVKTKGITLICGYQRPNTNFLREDLENLFDGNMIILAGDLNAKNTMWDCHRTNQTGRQLEQYCNDNNLTIYHPEEYTRLPSQNNQEPSIIDIVITKGTTINNIKTYHELPSDHNPVVFTIKQDIETEPPRRRRHRDYKKANWEGFRTEINQELKINRDLNSTNQIINEIEQVTTIIQNAINNNIPHAPDTREDDTPADIKNLIKERNRIRRQFQRGRNQDDADRMTQLNAEIKTRIWTNCENTWHSNIRKAIQEKGNVWRFIKARKRKGNPSYIPTLEEGDAVHQTSAEKANLLANTYAGVSRITKDLNDLETNAQVETEYQEILNEDPDTPSTENTSPMEIKKIIRAMKPTKAPGIDEIMAISLKNIPRKMLAQLYYIYKACIQTQIFPEPWKNAIIIPIPKPKKPLKNPTSYRPISLLTTMSKILERIALKKINNHIYRNKVIIEEQFGFVPEKSTTLQLARIIDKTKVNFNTNKVTTMAVLDLEKAYDTVWHKGLIVKMARSGIPPHLVKIVDDYLKRRTIQVQCNGELSEKKEITTGVPQGSTLSPTLFNLYINDIPRTENSELALFADDTAIIAQSTSEKQAKSYVQEHLDILSEYFGKWKLKINEDKTQIITFTQKKKRPHPPINIQINGVLIEEEKTIKYLGVHLDQKLTFKEHIDQTRKKAAAARKFILPYIQQRVPISRKTKIQLYKTYVHPILTYAAPAWSSAAKSNLRKLQVSENTCLRTIANKKNYEISNERLYQELGIEPLLRKIKLITRKFYQYKTAIHDITRNVGRFNSGNAPFRIKHRLINAILED